eukprot:CAMPEP_0119403298 /NCGR_PEP_ID=MMETSP1334-20130426/143317_1 /TAXON_ID=127549 /ORGANISM="Calcidiscus leptoporus, Strain RCC1130" /LENGTH=384 /DNA_ID=CAMNT_0007427243 /DNA_START=105 /DNA_END=1260 /DNA_ORIENTATION=+
MGVGSLKDQEIVVLEWTSSRELKSRCKQKRYEPQCGMEGFLNAEARDLQLTVGGKSQVGVDVLIWERSRSGMSHEIFEDGTVDRWFADATDGSLSPGDNFDLVIGYGAAGKSPSPKQFDDWPAQQREGRLHPVLVPKGDETALVFTDVYKNPALPTREEYAAAAAAAAAANDYSLNTPTKAIKGMRLSLRVTHKTLAAVCLGAKCRDGTSDCKHAGFWLLLREKSDVGESTVAQATDILAKGAVRAGVPLARDVAPAPGVMERDVVVLVQRVRSGGTIHGEEEAKPYADSLEFKKSNHTGPYCVFASAAAACAAVSASRAATTATAAPFRFAARTTSSSPAVKGSFASGRVCRSPCQLLAASATSTSSFAAIGARGIQIREKRG